VRDVYVQAIDLLLEPEISVFVSNQNVSGEGLHIHSINILISKVI